MSASSASTWLPRAGRYITPLTTIGVTSGLLPAAVFVTRRGTAPRGARTTASSRASTLRTLFRRRRWPAAAASGGLRELHRPGLSQLRDITGIDVRERREAAAAEVAAEHRPVVAAGRRLAVLCHDRNTDDECR